MIVYQCGLLMHYQHGFDSVSKMKLQSNRSWQNVSCMGRVIAVGRHWLNAWMGRRSSINRISLVINFPLHPPPSAAALTVAKWADSEYVIPSG